MRIKIKQIGHVVFGDKREVKEVSSKSLADTVVTDRQTRLTVFHTHIGNTVELRNSIKFINGKVYIPSGRDGYELITNLTDICKEDISEIVELTTNVVVNNEVVDRQTLLDGRSTLCPKYILSYEGTYYHFDTGKELRDYLSDRNTIWSDHYILWVKNYTHNIESEVNSMPRTLELTREHSIAQFLALL